MLFWIFVIIGAIALIGLIIPISGQVKLRTLQRAADSTYQIWFDASPSVYSKQEYINIIEARDKARKELEDFKQSKQYERLQRKETVNAVCKVIAVGCAIVLVIMSFVLIGIYAGSGGERVGLEAEYDVLSWEVENNIYQDGGDDVVGKKELYNQVREWNSNLASNQYYEKNFWIGIFVPNIYGDLKPIELN